MQLNTKFEELNSFAKTINLALYGIYSEYLNTDIPFDSKVEEELLKSYVELRHKLYYKKNEKAEGFLSKVDEDRKKNIEELKSPTQFEILSEVSKKISIQIVKDSKKYIPTDEESLNKIKEKLSIIYKNLEFSEINKIYGEVKQELSKNNYEDKENIRAYLQNLYVCFMLDSLIYSKKLENKRVLMNYEDVCKEIGEEVFQIKDNKKIK